MVSTVPLSGTNLQRVGDHNQRITLHAIRVKGPTTRVELSNITGLTQAAIANITNRLLAEGLIEEAGVRRGGRGQPATDYVVRAEACYSLGVNVDRDHVTCVLVNFAGKTVARRSLDTMFAMPAEVSKLYRSWVPSLLAEGGVDHSKVVGLGVAMPDDLGSVYVEGRPAEYEKWGDVQLEELFDIGFDWPVFRENDAAAAAMGEMQLGLGHRYASFFYVLISLGLGGGVVVDGNYFRGAQGRSGEIGFLPASDEAEGSAPVQNLVSLSGLAHLLSERAGAMPASRELSLDDEIVRGWVERSAELLTRPLLAVNCLINPNAVLIGGRLPCAIVDALAERLNGLLAGSQTRAPAVAPVRRAMLSDDAPAVGGAILPFSQFLLPKATSLWKS